MSEDTTVHAELRENFGKGFARRLRAAGKIPAVLYGHGTDPVHVALPGHQMLLLVRHANALIELDIAGKSQLALVKDVQKDPVNQIIEHIDLVVINKGEKVQVDVPVIVVGESFSGTIVNQDAQSVSLDVEAISIPQHVEVDVEGLEEGARITAGELTLPQGAVLLTDPEVLVIAISVPAAASADETGAEDEAAADASGAADDAATESE
ncbi:50S ribosomal protein L25/general stress protein Ctc [Microbacterium schleiferi]|uniref:Large ribosomal subunit protein bL25 n=2 Tax=Microbacterium schleiferi TaxID=69362 RepID=A0A7S8MV87_9MICO|nr:50S ribosomal protein L25/general stress protein Ctc [Microbacterium schleiferi]QPE03792.1 50S ribosomal protein L25/general stress protein Ctc [Microbacterium schleiferi]